MFNAYPEVQIISSYYFDMKELVSQEAKLPSLPVWVVNNPTTFYKVLVNNNPYYVLEGGQGIDCYLGLYQLNQDQLILVAEAGWAPDCGDDILHKPLEKQIQYLWATYKEESKEVFTKEDILIDSRYSELLTKYLSHSSKGKPFKVTTAGRQARSGCEDIDIKADCFEITIKGSRNFDTKKIHDLRKNFLESLAKGSLQLFS